MDYTVLATSDSLGGIYPEPIELESHEDFEAALIATDHEARLHVRRNSDGAGYFPGIGWVLESGDETV